MKANAGFKRLVVSATRQKLIQAIFCQPREIFYVRQLVRLVGEEINSVRRELENLRSADILTSEARGNRLYYAANPHHPLYHDLIILANKTSGLAAKLSVPLLFYSHRFLLGHDPDPNRIDMIIVGNVSLRDTQSVVKEEETRRSREINYMVMDRSEFQLRRSKRDPLLVDFFLDNPVVIIGSPEIL